MGCARHKTTPRRLYQPDPAWEETGHMAVVGEICFRTQGVEVGSDLKQKKAEDNRYQKESFYENCHPHLGEQNFTRFGYGLKASDHRC